MCRLLAIVSPEPRSVRETLGDEQLDHLVNLAHVHADGWGTTWLDEHGRLQRHVSPFGARHDAAFAKTLDVPTVARLVHLRFATGGMAVAAENTHPFRHGDLTFAHNGSILPSARLLDLVPDEQRAELRGTTDSEMYFALVRAELDAGAADLGTAVARAVGRIRAEFPVASLNSMLLTPRELVVTRASTDTPSPLREIEATGSAHLMPAEHQEHYFRLWTRPFPDGGIAVASTGLNSDGWQQLGEDTVTTWDVRTRDQATVPVDAPVVARPAQ